MNMKSWVSYFCFSELITENYGVMGGVKRDINRFGVSDVMRGASTFKFCSGFFTKNPLWSVCLPAKIVNTIFEEGLEFTDFAYLIS